MTHEGQIGVYFTSSGYRLIGTLFLAPGDDPKPTALLLHGCPGFEKNHDIAYALRQQGWNSLVFHLIVIPGGNHYLAWQRAELCQQLCTWLKTVLSAQFTES